MKKLLVTFCIAMFISPALCFSQTNNEEAMALYQKAEQQYENKKYEDCNNTLVRIYNLLGSWNVKILYLIIKSTFESVDFPGRQDHDPNIKYNIMYYEGWKQLTNQIDLFFKMVNKNNYPPEKYSEILNIKLEAEPF